MSKRSDKSNRGKKGKRDTEMTASGIWEAKSRSRGRVFVVRMKFLKRAVRSVMRDVARETGTSAAQLFAGFMLSLDKAENRLSCRGLANRMDRPGEPHRRYGFGYRPSKSTLHAAVTAFASAGKGVMDRIPTLLAVHVQGGAVVDMHGDSTGVSTDRHPEWLVAKYGTQEKRALAKLHVITANKGPIFAFEVTPYNVGGPPTFRKMIARVPRAVQGGSIVLDSAYLAEANCRAIRETGRTAVIMPKRNTRTAGFGLIHGPAGRLRDDPEGFMLEYNKRSNAEAVFSSIKGKTGTHMRARSLGTQTAELFARVMLYNLKVM